MKKYEQHCAIAIKKAFKRKNPLTTLVKSPLFSFVLELSDFVSNERCCTDR